MTPAEAVSRDRAVQTVLSLPAKYAIRGDELQFGVAWIHRKRSPFYRSTM